jgi:hypothetical protein
MSLPRPNPQSAMIYSFLALVLSLVWVLFIDTLNLCFSLLRIRSLVLFSRSLLPRYVIPSLSSLLNETQQLLEHAEEIGAIPPENDYRALLDLCEGHCIDGPSSHAYSDWQISLQLCARRAIRLKGPSSSCALRYNAA